MNHEDRSPQLPHRPAVVVRRWEPDCYRRAHVAATLGRPLPQDVVAQVGGLLQRQTQAHVVQVASGRHWLDGDRFDLLLAGRAGDSYRRHLADRLWEIGSSLHSTNGLLATGLRVKIAEDLPGQRRLRRLGLESLVPLQFRVATRSASSVPVPPSRRD
jgi:hypothetical protein